MNDQPNPQDAPKAAPEAAPRVSVVIPAYNAMRYLPQTVASVLAQTFGDFEVLIVDDGSQDDTAGWAAAHPDARVRLVARPNGGAAAARNTGVQHAAGEYVAFLDADDLWQPTKLEQQVARADADPEVGLVDCWISYIDGEGEPIGKVMTQHLEGDVWAHMVEYNLVRCGSTPLVRRRLFDEVGSFDEGFRYAEDWEMWIRITARYKFAVVKEPLVAYRQHANNKHKNYQSLLPTLCRIIEKSFEDVPAAQQHLKGRALGRAYLHTAWRSLLYTGDAGEASQLRREAFAHYPGLRYAKNSIRLGLTIMKTRWLRRLKSIGTQS